MSISFETLALAKRYTNSAVADAIGGVAKIDFRFVTSLPLAGESGVIYCVSNGGSEPDLYDEYYYVNGRFERIPGARIDLTPYATKNWVTGEGYYKKPADGIPGTDLDAALRASIAKAETALQRHQSLAAYRTAQEQDEIDNTLANIKEIEVGDTEPTDPNVKLWMYQNPGQKIEIPTMEDFRNLKPATDEQVSAAVGDWLEENISGGETIAVDKSLTIEGAAADAKAVGDLKSAVNDLGDVAAIKTAMLQLASKVAYINDHGQTYYDDLYYALYPKTLQSISAVYTQSGVVYDTDTLESLKSDLVVTATYTDLTTKVLAEDMYALSGNLTPGISVVTVSYKAATTTFNVTVTEEATSGETKWSNGVPYADFGLTNDTYISNTGNNKGELVPYTGWKTTNNLYCDGAAKLTFRALANSSLLSDSNLHYQAFYDSNKQFIQNFGVEGLGNNESGTYDLVVPPNAAYFRLSGNQQVFDRHMLEIVPYASI